MTDCVGRWLSHVLGAHPGGHTAVVILALFWWAVFVIALALLVLVWKRATRRAMAARDRDS